MKETVLVFLPTYNERENLPQVVEQLLALDYDLSILIVDDLSPDGTGDAADQLAEQHPNLVRVIHRDGPRGRGKAGILGLKEASQSKAEYIVEMDADLSHNPAQLPSLMEAAKDHDLVIGSRYIEGGSAESFGIFRMLNSKVAKFLSWLVLGLNQADPTSGYRVYRRGILAKLPWDAMISPGPSIVEETLYYIKRLNGRIIEKPICYEDRRSGSTKITIGIILRWIQTLFLIRSTANKELRRMQ